ncbi:MAG TPA: 1,4-dihydroxy-2-naphthoate polyprenyltransferase [Acidimicrobiales bacterium]|nr:1,4-dihydroxy-2-naphthoate polyprenyltransferase [Acidimicrobiales bacterium]
MASRTEWVGAARPRTLGAALSAVAVGIGVGEATRHVVVWRAVAALVVALCMQIGTNFANDYSDGVRGTDARRVGPRRLVASGLASPRSVRRVAMAAFFVGAATGLGLAVAVAWWLIPVGAACIAAGWFYTGGPRPYGYSGLGELFVFVFFGLVAVVGTAYVSSGRIPSIAWVAAVPVGLLSVALLVVNNLRDIDSDRAAGKRTLAVLVGDQRTRLLYLALLAGAFGFVVAAAAMRGFALLGLAAFPLAVRPLTLVRSGAKGPALITALAMTGGLQIAFGVLFAIGIAL